MHILVILLLFSCSSIFVQDDRIISLWEGKHQFEIVEKLGPYTRVINVEDGDGGQILIWEASKESVLLPIEKLSLKEDKKGTSISSFHVFIDKNGYITDIKRTVW